MTNTEQKRAPSHNAYTVRSWNKGTFWVRIGRAWAHADGEGYSIHLDALPLDGQITLRVLTDVKV